jgi:hypothetical protein
MTTNFFDSYFSLEPLKKGIFETIEEGSAFKVILEV